jgi:hypothetical protein
MEESSSIGGMYDSFSHKVLLKLIEEIVQDYHPPGHISFASSHPGQKAFASITVQDKQGKDIDQILWPDHCVRLGTSNHSKAALLTSLAWIPSGTRHGGV